MNTIKTIPAIISFLLLGAHFLRSGQVVLVVLSLICMIFLFVRRSLITTLLQLLLVLGAIEWIQTTIALVAMRKALGETWLRMGIILGVVTVFTLLSAFLLHMRKTKES